MSSPALRQSSAAENAILITAFVTLCVLALAEATDQGRLDFARAAPPRRGRDRHQKRAFSDISHVGLMPHHHHHDLVLHHPMDLPPSRIQPQSDRCDTVGPAGPKTYTRSVQLPTQKFECLEHHVASSNDSPFCHQCSFSAAYTVLSRRPADAGSGRYRAPDELFQQPRRRWIHFESSFEINNAERRQVQPCAVNEAEARSCP